MTTPSTSTGTGTTGTGWRSSGSPGRLRAATAVTVLLAVALAFGGTFAVDRRADSIDDASAAAAQLIRVQDVRVLVVQADSLASTAYLVGGQEPAEQREAYDERISAAATGLVAVAGGVDGDGADSLSRASGLLSAYVGLVEQARANNRQGFPVGAAYQRQARVAAQQLVEELRAVEQQARERVNDRMERAHRSSWLLVLPAIVVLGALVLGSVWLAARWRRLVNVPIALAGLIALAVLTAGVGTNARAVGTAADAVTGSLTAADLLAQARAAAFDARSNEALTLIARGNGAAYEAAWLDSSAVAVSAMSAACEGFDLGCDAEEDLEAYRDAHATIRELDDGGDWDAAVELSLTGDPDAPPGRDPVRSFESFGAATQRDVAEQTEVAAAGFRDAVDPLGTLRAMVLLAGITIAVLAVAGYGLRLREYR